MNGDEPERRCLDNRRAAVSAGDFAQEQRLQQVHAACLPQPMTAHLLQRYVSRICGMRPMRTDVLDRFVTEAQSISFLGAGRWRKWRESEILDSSRAKLNSLLARALCISGETVNADAQCEWGTSAIFFLKECARCELGTKQRPMSLLQLRLSLNRRLTTRPPSTRIERELQFLGRLPQQSVQALPQSCDIPLSPVTLSMAGRHSAAYSRKRC